MSLNVKEKESAKESEELKKEIQSKSKNTFDMLMSEPPAFFKSAVSKAERKGNRKKKAN